MSNEFAANPIIQDGIILLFVAIIVAAWLLTENLARVRRLWEWIRTSLMASAKGKPMCHVVLARDNKSTIF